MKQYLSWAQHGFIPSMSITNLSNFVNYMSKALDYRGQMDVIYTNFARVFDKVKTALLQKI